MLLNSFYHLFILKGNKMKVFAKLNKIISKEYALRIAKSASKIKPVYGIASIDPLNIGTKSAIHLKLADGHKGDFSVYKHREYNDGSVTLCIGYHSELSGNIEIISIFTDICNGGNEYSLKVYLDCKTTRGAFKERMIPILNSISIHPSEFDVAEIKTSAGSNFRDRCGKFMPWWQTKGEYAFDLACGKVADIDVSEQTLYAVELVHEAIGCELDAKFRDKTFPRWVIEFSNSLVNEANHDSDASERCRKLADLWNMHINAVNGILSSVD